METNLKTIPQSGGVKSLSLASFTQLCNDEYTVKHDSMVAEYKERKDYLLKSCERKIAEYKFIDLVIEANTCLLKQEPNSALIISLEVELSKLNYENVAASFPIDFWRVQYGETMIIQVLSDVMFYFLSQFQVKEMLSQVQVVQLASKLLAAQPKLRIMELVFVLNNALRGDYGPTYQRIGIDMILEWLTKFYEGYADYLEGKRLGGKEEGSRGETPWVEMENQLKKYEQEQRDKKRVAESVWGFEKKVEQKLSKEESFKQATNKYYENKRAIMSRTDLSDYKKDCAVRDLSGIKHLSESEFTKQNGDI